MPVWKATCINQMRWSVFDIGGSFLLKRDNAQLYKGIQHRHP